MKTGTFNWGAREDRVGAVCSEREHRRYSTRYAPLSAKRWSTRALLCRLADAAGGLRTCVGFLRWGSRFGTRRRDALEYGAKEGRKRRGRTESRFFSAERRFASKRRLLRKSFFTPRGNFSGAPNRGAEGGISHPGAAVVRVFSECGRDYRTDEEIVYPEHLNEELVMSWSLRW